MFGVLKAFLLFGVASGQLEETGVFSQTSNTEEYERKELCEAQSELYRIGLKNDTLWAYEILDSSAKSVSGLLMGNSLEMGNFGECMGVKGPFPTQHCVMRLQIRVLAQVNLTRGNSERTYASVFTKFLKPYSGRDSTRIGLCMPASCSTSDVGISLTSFLSAGGSVENESPKYNVTITDYTCTSQLDSNGFGPLQVAFCVFCALLIFLVLTSTSIHYRMEEEKENFDSPKSLDGSTWTTVFLAFSAMRTWKILFRVSDNHDQLKIFHGIKTISEMLIVFAHVGYMASTISWIDEDTVENLAKSKFIYFYGQLTMVLEVFFLMSGLLLSYGMLKKMRNRKFGFNPFLLILLRYVRLTPVNAFVTFYFAAMLTHSGSGPAWNLITRPQEDTCLSNWWANLLYVNNIFVNADDCCNRITWYISADFHLFVMGVLVMYVLGKNQRAGYAILTLLFILSILVPFAITMRYNFAMIAMNNKDPVTYSNLYYVKPYTYATSYVLGLVGGIIYDRLVFQKVELTRKSTYLIFGVSSVLMAISYGYPIIFNNEQENYLYENAVYNGIYKRLWSVGLLGTFVVASFGSNTTLRSFLSSHVWIPFSKLSYGIYLVHWAVLIVSFANRTDLFQPSLFNSMSLLISVSVLSVAVAFLLYFLIEMPILRIFSMVLLPNEVEKREDKEERNGAVPFQKYTFQKI